ncbi:hypothetical protein [Myxococcus sp. RHSTA-1-4]|uniref:hypothetical protein n=1 Tax=Myxococcus sp. RHSTA-1-4 TaxID=2874601 RepID=UPI001CC1A4E9|nr:hypothetical protein [Myxococcus sp. RHSTA-1-4]
MTIEPLETKCLRTPGQNIKLRWTSSVTDVALVQDGVVTGAQVREDHPRCDGRQGAHGDSAGPHHPQHARREGTGRAVVSVVAGRRRTAAEYVVP